MRPSEDIRQGILRFYERFSAGDPDGFDAGLARTDGVSVIGTAPEEGHDNREDWVKAYREGIAAAGLRLEGTAPRGYEEGSVGFGTDRPSFVLPDGSRLPTRLTAVLRREDDDWKVVHLHFSVGVPDEEAIQPATA
jgi:SnoaL-like protein